jgi:hypothetical protein
LQPFSRLHAEAPLALTLEETQPRSSLNSKIPGCSLTGLILERHNYTQQDKGQSGFGDTNPSPEQLKTWINAHKYNQKQATPLGHTLAKEHAVSLCYNKNESKVIAL